MADSAHILKTETEAQLNQMITELEAKNGAEVAVVTVPETEPAASPKVFATELFNTWHIGKQGQDNGVLLLISTGDRCGSGSGDFGGGSSGGGAGGSW